VFVKDKLTAFLFAASLVWGIWVYGATETQTHYRLFLLCLIPTVLATWKNPVTLRSILVTAIGVVLILNVVLRSTLQAEGYLVAALGWMAFFIVTQLSARSRTAMHRLMLFVVLIGAGEAFYGFLQYFGQRQEYVTGTLVNRNHFAGLLNMAIAMALGATYAGFSRRVRADIEGSDIGAWSWLAGLASALIGLAVLLSGSRGGVLTLIATLLLVCLLLGIKRHARTAASLPARYAWILLVAILGFGAWAGADALVLRFTETQAGLADRALIAKASVQLIADHPLRGVGPGMYKWRFRPYQPGPVTLWYDHAHNDYLQVAAEWGIPVAVAFWGTIVWSFLASARLFLRDRHDPWIQGISLGCVGALFSILVHSLVDFNLQIPTNLMLFCIVLGLSFSIRGSRREARG